MKKRIITPDDGFHRIHTYFKGSPYHPDGERILYTRCASLRDGVAEVCILDRRTGEETALGESRYFNYHVGARSYFCDGGNRVIFMTDTNAVACVDLRSGKRKQFKGHVCAYSGNLRDRFIEMDMEFPIEKQGKMGIYIRNIDGADKKCLATVDDLFDAHPMGRHIRNAGVMLRLGGEISPDQKKVALFLVTKVGTLVRDYYTCGTDGSSLTFHGRLGMHIMWRPDSRRIVSCASPFGCSYFPHLRGKETEFRYNLLASYDTQSRRMEILSNRRLRLGCHACPSRDGTKIVTDSLQPDELDIMLYDCKTRRMRRIVREKLDLNVEARDKKRPPKVGSDQTPYKVNAHPAFSHDSRKILFNSCTDGRVRLCEIEV